MSGYGVLECKSGPQHPSDLGLCLTRGCVICEQIHILHFVEMELNPNLDVRPDPRRTKDKLKTNTLCN
jgi:hypothetical protein